MAWRRLSRHTRLNPSAPGRGGARLLTGLGRAELVVTAPIVTAPRVAAPQSQPPSSCRFGSGSSGNLRLLTLQMDSSGHLGFHSCGRFALTEVPWLQGSPAKHNQTVKVQKSDIRHHKP